VKTPYEEIGNFGALHQLAYHPTSGSMHQTYLYCEEFLVVDIIILQRLWLMLKISIFSGNIVLGSCCASRLPNLVTRQLSQTAVMWFDLARSPLGGSELGELPLCVISI